MTLLGYMEEQAYHISGALQQCTERSGAEGSAAHMFI